MTDKILKFPDRETRSLEELCELLRKHYTKLDEIDRGFLALIYSVLRRMPTKSASEAIGHCKEIAVVMVRRNGLTEVK
jgi:hypothetical protein